jgi:hypothetical protein
MKDKLFRVKHKYEQTGFNKEIFYLVCEDEKIILAKKVNLSSASIEPHVISFYKDDWIVTFDIGQDIIDYLGY